MSILRLITLSILLMTLSFRSMSIYVKHENYPDYILFGIFCGECKGHCATMYKYNMKNNPNTLFVDTTDSFFKNEGNVILTEPISDPKKMALINILVKQIPTQLLKSKELTRTFGCPDCTDGCGIYFEFRQEGKIKKIYIDYNTKELSNDIKLFSEHIKSTISQLNNNN